MFNEVLAVGDESGLKFGTPYIDGMTVTGEIVKNGKAKKITVFTYKPKNDSKRKLGHRQPYSKVLIKEIGEAKPKRKRTAAKKTEENDEI